MYCGVDKATQACRYLERYHKAGLNAQLNALYEQLLKVLEETKNLIERWLF